MPVKRRRIIIMEPMRPGNRGGTGHFKWENVKSDKDREHYLGHSLHAPVGRWQMGKDLQWFAKTSKSAARTVNGKSADIREKMKAEIRAIKQQEEELQLEALGLKPRDENRWKRELSDEKKRKLLARGQTERDEKLDMDRVAGLGYAPSRRVDGHEDDTLVNRVMNLNTPATSRLEGTVDNNFQVDPNLVGAHGEFESKLAARAAKRAKKDAKAAKKAAKKAKKTAKKAKKKARKAAKKKAKQERRKRKRTSSSDDSSNSSDNDDDDDDDGDRRRRRRRRSRSRSPRRERSRRRSRSRSRSTSRSKL